jgi:hypothetical protein
MLTGNRRRQCEVLLLWMQLGRGWVGFGLGCIQTVGYKLSPSWEDTRLQIIYIRVSVDRLFFRVGCKIEILSSMGGINVISEKLS